MHDNLGKKIKKVGAMFLFPHKKHLWTFIRNSVGGQRCFFPLVVSVGAHETGRKRLENVVGPFSSLLSFRMTKLTSSIHVQGNPSISRRTIHFQEGVCEEIPEKEVEDEEEKGKKRELLRQRIAYELLVIRQSHNAPDSSSRQKEEGLDHIVKGKIISDPLQWRSVIQLFQGIPWIVGRAEGSDSSFIESSEYTRRAAQDRVLVEQLLFTLFRMQCSSSPPPTVYHAVYLLCRPSGVRRGQRVNQNSEKENKALPRSPFYPKGLYFHYGNYLYQQCLAAASLGKYVKAHFFASRCLVVLLIHAPVDDSATALRPSSMILGLQALHQWERYQNISEGKRMQRHGTRSAARDFSSLEFPSQMIAEKHLQCLSTDIGEGKEDEKFFSQWIAQKPTIPTTSLSGGVLTTPPSSPIMGRFSSNAGEMASSLLCQVCMYPSTPASTLLRAIHLFLSLSSPFSKEGKGGELLVRDRGAPQYCDEPLSSLPLLEDAFFPLPSLGWRNRLPSDKYNMSDNYKKDRVDREMTSGSENGHEYGWKKNKKMSGRGMKRKGDERQGFPPLWCVTDSSTPQGFAKGGDHLWQRLAPHWGDVLWNGNVLFALDSATRVVEFLQFLKGEDDPTTWLSEPSCVWPEGTFGPKGEDVEKIRNEVRQRLQRALFLVLDFPLDPQKKMWTSLNTNSMNSSSSSTAAVQDGDSEASTSHHLTLPCTLVEEQRRFCSLLGWLTHLLMESLALIRDVEGPQSARWCAHSVLVSNTLRDIFFFVKKIKDSTFSPSSVRCSPQEVEQELWSLVFDRIRRGVFCLENVSGGEIIMHDLAEKEDKRAGRNAEEGHREPTIPCIGDSSVVPSSPSTCSPFHRGPSSCFTGDGHAPERLSWISALYDSAQWQHPTINAYVDILHEWKQSRGMGEVFRVIERREYHALKAARRYSASSSTHSLSRTRSEEEKITSDSTSRDSFARKEDTLEMDKEKQESARGLEEQQRLPLALWKYSPSLSLSSCAKIIENCCEDPVRRRNIASARGEERKLNCSLPYQDPFLAKDVVKYMLMHLLLLQEKSNSASPLIRVPSSREEEEEGKNFNFTSDESRTTICDGSQTEKTEIECARWRSWIESVAFPLIIETVKRLKMKVNPEEWILE